MAKKKTTKRKTPAKPKKPATKKTPSHDDVALADVVDTEVTPPDFAVVGVGASAGGLDAFRKFLEPLPADCGMAFVLVQHLDPTHASHTAELLGAHTQLPVVEVSDGMRVQPNRVYMIPPGAFLSISGNTLRLSEPVERRGVRLPIDFFFRALAEDQQERAICVILSGTGSDGTLGLREVKAAGGIVLAQQPETTQFDGMPRSAIATGLVDYLLPPEQMADALSRYIRHWYVNGDTPPPADRDGHDLKAILAILRARIKYDFSCYKKGTLSRRVQRRMGLRQVENLAEYAGLLRAEPDEATALFKDLLIGVTNFFREAEAWPVLRDEVIRPLVRGTIHAENRLTPSRQATASGGVPSGDVPSPAGSALNDLFRSNPATDEPLRIWVPGCATGEEAYSIAMLLSEELHAAGKEQDVQIFASDIDQDALSLARAGIYPENIAVDVSPQRLRQFFIKGEHTYRINKELREAVVFAAQNLVGDPPFARLDLISCRNLLIYLEPDVQQRIIAMFHFALREGGCLFLGNSETIGGQHDLFQPLSKKWRIYRRIGPLRPDKVMFPIAASRDVPAPQPPRSAAATALLGVSRLTQQLLLERYVPASVLVNRQLEVLYLHGATDAYLQLPAGEPTSNLLAMAREGLRTRLRSVVQQAVEDGETAGTTARIRREGKYDRVQITAEPLRHPRAAEGLLLITFDADRGVGFQPASAVVDQAEKLGERPAAEKTGRLEARATDGRLEAYPTGETDQLVAQLEDELRNSREEMQGLIEELETSNEEMKATNQEATSVNEELQRLGRELHDTLGQQVAAIGMMATRLREQLTAESSPLGDQAERLLDTIDEAQRQVRALFKGLLPVELDSGGLMSALGDLADQTQSLHEIDCRFECDDPVQIHDSLMATHLYRIAQEAVHNAVKHSGAGHIVIHLHDDTGIALQIRDDGSGMADNRDTASDQPTGSTNPSGAGLRIMRYRAHLIGGRLTIHPATPHGTIVECKIPIEPD